MQLGERIRGRMSHLGVSQAELARRVGVSQPAIHALLTRNKSGTRQLHLIAKALGTTPAFLSGSIDDPSEGAETGQQLSSEETEWLEIFAGLTPEQRRTLRALGRDLARGNSPSTRIHDAGIGFMHAEGGSP